MDALEYSVIHIFNRHRNHPPLLMLPFMPFLDIVTGFVIGPLVMLLLLVRACFETQLSHASAIVAVVTSIVIRLVVVFWFIRVCLWTQLSALMILVASEKTAGVKAIVCVCANAGSRYARH